jgi:hypothetical protein
MWPAALLSGRQWQVLVFSRSCKSIGKYSRRERGLALLKDLKPWSGIKHQQQLQQPGAMKEQLKKEQQQQQETE